MLRNKRSRWTETGVHDAPKQAFTMDRYEQKVRHVHIGTHNLQVEIGLRHLFRDVLKWVCIDDYPCDGTADTPWGPVIFLDESRIGAI